MSMSLMGGLLIGLLTAECFEYSAARRGRRNERITHVAIAYDSGVWSLPKPCRHHHIIHTRFDATGAVTGGGSVQGFLTNKGRFVDRAQALKIAAGAGQIVEKHGNPTELYSEDLW